MVNEQFLMQLLQQKDLPLYTILIIYLYMKFDELNQRLSRLEAKFSSIEKYVLHMDGGSDNEETSR